MEQSNRVVGDALVTTIQYEPNGSGHSLQRAITQLMHNRVKDVGRFTLAELGYLHANTLTYDKETGNIHLRVYFDARLASRVVTSQVNQKKVRAPIVELDVFQNYLFVGDYNQAITYDTILVPKGKSREDEANRLSYSFGDDSKLVDMQVLILNCNLPVTLAAAHNINLTDPNFDVKCETVGKGGKTSMKMIVAESSSREVPVAVTIMHTADGEYTGYDPDDAVPYLVSLMDKSRTVTRNREKIQTKVREEAKAKTKKKAKPTNAWFSKYS